MEREESSERAAGAEPAAGTEPATETTGDETPEEYREQVENDPSQNPDDEDLERVRGG